MIIRKLMQVYFKKQICKRRDKKDKQDENSK